MAWVKCPLEKMPPPVTIEEQISVRENPSFKTEGQYQAMIRAHFLSTYDIPPEMDLDEIEEGAIDPEINRIIYERMMGANLIRDRAGIKRTVVFGEEKQVTFLLNVPEDAVLRYARELPCHKTTSGFAVSIPITLPVIYGILHPVEGKKALKASPGEVVPCYRIYANFESHVDLGVTPNGRVPVHLQSICISKNPGRNCEYETRVPPGPFNVPCSVEETIKIQKEQLNGGEALRLKQLAHQQKKKKGEGYSGARGKRGGR